MEHIRISKLRIYGLDESINASANPHIDNEEEFLTGKCIDKNRDRRSVTLGTAHNGSGHDKYLRGIIVQFNLSAGRYFWQEWDTYHHAESVSSMSTVYCASKMNIEKLAGVHVDKEMLKILQKHINNYNANKSEENFLKVKENWIEGIRIGRSISTNYNTIKTMYTQRHNHKLPQWKELCQFFVNELPRFEELCLKKVGDA